MFKRQNRLLKTKDIMRVHREGELFFTKFFILKFLKNNLDQTRFTILVSAKVSKRAVVRNRIKRIIREHLRLKIKDIKPGYDIVISCSKNCVTSEGEIISSEKISDALDFALRKTNLYETSSSSI